MTANTNGRIPPWQEGSGRALMAACSVAALGAFAGGIGATLGASLDRFWLEVWRTAGFFVFSGLFALLAWRPRLSAGVWELAFADKLALVVVALASGSPEAKGAAWVDAALALALAASYLATRGWRSWRATEGR